MLSAGTSRATTLPVAMIVSSTIVTPSRTSAPPPSQLVQALVARQLSGVEPICLEILRIDEREAAIAKPGASRERPIECGAPAIAIEFSTTLRFELEFLS